MHFTASYRLFAIQIFENQALRPKISVHSKGCDNPSILIKPSIRRNSFQLREYQRFSAISKEQQNQRLFK